MLWDFTKVKFKDYVAMRYDTPGDWTEDEIRAWSGLGRIEYVRADNTSTPEFNPNKEKSAHAHTH